MESKPKWWKPPQTHYMGIETPKELRECAECRGDLGAMAGHSYYMRDKRGGGEERICRHCAGAPTPTAKEPRG